MCLYEKEIKNRRYIKNKKNGGLIPPVPDKRLENLTIGCGRCIECRKETARDWQLRLLEEIKTHKNGKMVTFTFSNQAIIELIEHSITRLNKRTQQKETIKIKDLYGYEKDNAIATKAVRLFVERWRKIYKTSIRHWLITELGHKGTENIHLHGIIWTDEPMTKVETIWKYGFIWKGYKIKDKIVNYVNGRTVTYITKYVSKIDQRNKEYKPKVLASNKPGIGANYTNTYNATLNKYNNANTNETYKTSTGHKIKLPAYWRNKIYSEKEKEQLWINKLDNGIKYIMGEKIDITQGYKLHNNILNFYRQLNAQLGYGGQPNENRKEHEEKRREELIQRRIKKASGGV